MTMPSDKVIEEYIKSNVEDGTVVLSADEITESIRLMKEEMTPEQLSLSHKTYCGTNLTTSKTE